MSGNNTFAALIAVAICSTFWQSLAQARLHHHKNVAKKDKEIIIGENAMLFSDMPELFAELSGDGEELAVNDKKEYRIQKRHISGNDLPSASRCDTDLKGKIINIYADATLLHSDKKDQALMREMLKAAMKWNWSSYQEFITYADKIFLEVKGRHENEVD